MYIIICSNIYKPFIFIQENLKLLYEENKLYEENE